MPIDVVSHSHPGHSDSIQVTQVPSSSGSSSSGFSASGAIGGIVGTLWDIGKYIANWTLTNKANQQTAEYNSPEAKFKLRICS